MKKKFVTLFLLTPMILTGCVYYVSDTGSSESFATRNVNIYRDKDKVDKTIALRFYDDMPNVPYISVSKYYDEFFNTRLIVSKNGSVYTYKNRGFTRFYFGFDTEQDLFFSNFLPAFNSHPDFKTATGKTFININKEEMTTTNNNVVSLKNYSIPIYGDYDEAYVPLTFLSQYAGGYSLYNIAYNGKDIYVIDYSAYLFDEEKTPSTYGDSYFEKLSNLSEPRPVDLAKYTYNELCFVFDNYRGYTSQLLFGDNNLQTLGLNGLLETYYPTLKQYLLSTDKSKYYLGFETLFSGLYDGGHTVALNDFDEYDAAQEIEADQSFKDLKDEANARNKEKSKAGASAAIAKTLAAMPTGTYTLPGYTGKYSYSYNKEYKTAYIGFTGFDLDVEGWDDFYKGKGEIPVKTDTYAFVRSKFYQAKEDGAENVVLDISVNGGGSSYALAGLIGLVNGAKSYFSINDTFNKNRITDYYTIDINLDGKGDEEDVLEASKFDFNIGVLTSYYSFSCANLFPSMMKELGFKIMGQQSGGGSCAIYLTTTADGLMYVHSSNRCLSDQHGNNIDSGVPVDFAIEVGETGSVEGTYDYSKFFDPSITGSYLSTAYNPQQ